MRLLISHSLEGQIRISKMSNTKFSIPIVVTFLIHQGFVGFRFSTQPTSKSWRKPFPM